MCMSGAFWHTSFWLSLLVFCYLKLFLWWRYSKSKLFLNFNALFKLFKNVYKIYLNRFCETIVFILILIIYVNKDQTRRNGICYILVTWWILDSLADDWHFVWLFLSSFCSPTSLTYRYLKFFTAFVRVCLAGRFFKHYWYRFCTCGCNFVYYNLLQYICVFSKICFLELCVSAFCLWAITRWWLKRFCYSCVLFFL